MMEMVTGDAESFPALFIRMLRESLLKVANETAMAALPGTRDRWLELLAEPAADQCERFARVRAGIARNHQHPMIRVAPLFAAVAYRLTCAALKPWVRRGYGKAAPWARREHRPAPVDGVLECRRESRDEGNSAAWRGQRTARRAG